MALSAQRVFSTVSSVLYLNSHFIQLYSKFKTDAGQLSQKSALVIVYRTGIPYSAFYFIVIVYSTLNNKLSSQYTQDI